MTAAAAIVTVWAAVAAAIATTVQAEIVVLWCSHYDFW